MILNGAWKKNITDAFDEGEGLKGLFSPIRNNLLETIWQMSKTAFDEEREVQVVIDSDNTLFIGVGSGSFVSFDSEDIEKDTMKIIRKRFVLPMPNIERRIRKRFVRPMPNTGRPSVLRENMPSGMTLFVNWVTPT